MDEYVLDASAILALLQNEKGAEKVVPVVRRSKVSAVNLAEVGSRLTNSGKSVAQASTALEGLGLNTIVFDEEQAMETARLRPLTRSLQLSLSDRACLALAKLRHLPVMTTDRAWAKLNLGIQITVIR
jgi:PIN domain nuclease of toxin-antitoxin system